MRSFGRFATLWPMVFVLALATAACGSSGPYVWASQVAPAPNNAGQFVIVPGDALAITVYGDEQMSGTMRVRSDGYITLMLVGEVLAAGKTPTALAEELRAALTKFLKMPVVSVRIEEEAEISVAVMGEVETIGVVKLPRGSGLLWALSSAGGLSEFADWDGVYVIRGNPRVRIRFDFDDLIANDQKSTDFPLLDGDVIYVE